MGRNSKWDRNFVKLGITLTLSVCVCMIFYEILKARHDIFAYLGKIFSALTPIVIGIVIAFLLNPIMIYIRRGITFLVCRIKKTKSADYYDSVYKHTKLPALILTLAIFIGILTGFLYLIIPKIYESLTDLVASMPTYLNRLQRWVDKMFAKNARLEGQLQNVIHYLETDVFEIFKNQVMPNLDTIALKISSGVLLGVKMIMNTFIGIIVTVYLLYSKEKLLAQGRKMIYFIFSRKTGNKLMRAFGYANQVFGGFINGKILDSIIIGILCFALTSAIGMKYAVLCSVIVGVTNIIPFFGPFIGAVPGALLALMDDPVMFVVFIILIIFLQQFDGNILGPLILGDATGLSSLWVLISILVGGGLFGFGGMVLGVPVFACVYAFIAIQLRDGLRKKNLSSKTEDYIGLIGFDEETDEPIYREKHAKRKSLRQRKRRRVLYDRFHHHKKDQTEETLPEEDSDTPKDRD